jgi:hypothetical protein
MRQCTCEETISIVTRLLITDFYLESGVTHGEGQSIIEVHVGRLREKVPFKESPADHMSCYTGRRRNTIVGASEMQV